MYFSLKADPSFENCYATERPYTDLNQNQHSNKERAFLPTALADLTQLTDYYIRGSFANSRPHIFPETEAEIHTNLKNLCLSKGIIGEESKWDFYVDQQLQSLEDHYKNQADPTYLLDLAYKQLNEGGKIIKKVMFKEFEASENEQTLFWRVSHRGHNSDIAKCITSKEKISFGDSLFSGYNWDGIKYSNIEVSHSNYSACVYSYYDTYKQGTVRWQQIQRDGCIITGQHYKVQVKFKDLSDSLQNYLKNLNNHELYAVKFNNEELHDKMFNNKIAVPNSTISSAALYQAGEDFHPSIELLGNETMETFNLSEFN